MKKILSYGVALSVLVYNASAYAMAGNLHDNTQDRFFRCDVIDSLWHVLSTGHWPFYC